MKLNRFLFLLFLLLAFCVHGRCFAQQSNGVGTNEAFHGPVGIQMYSLRDYCKLDVEAGLKLAHDLGFKIIEPSSSFDKTAEEYREIMKKYGLYAISKNFHYGDLKTDAGLAKMAQIGKALGVKYVGIASLPFPKPMTEENMKEVAALFNHAGEVLAKEGLMFTFHNHGAEFVPWANGKENETLFDLLVQQTDPKYVAFELDVRWVGADSDPAELLRKYPTRFRLMHVKGESGPRGMRLEESKIDFAEVLKAGQEVGIEGYFLEFDDVKNLVPNTVENLRFLESLK